MDNFYEMPEEDFQPIEDGFIDTNGTQAGYRNMAEDLFDNPSDFDQDFF